MQYRSMIIWMPIIAAFLIISAGGTSLTVPEPDTSAAAAAAAPAAEAVLVEQSGDTSSSACSACPVGVLRGASVVCGNDGFSYANECLAECQGARVVSTGDCEGSRSPLFVGDTRWQARGSSSGSSDSGTDMAAAAASAAAQAADEKVSRKTMDKYAKNGYKFVGKAVSSSFTPKERQLNEIPPVAVKSEKLQASYTLDFDTGYLYMGAVKGLEAALSAASSSLGSVFIPPGCGQPPAFLKQLASSGSGETDTTTTTTLASSSGGGGGHTSSGASAIGRKLKLVWGSDDRQEITDANTRWPYTAITHLSMGCTGVLISESAVLTAGHCVYDSWLGWQKGVLATPGAHREVTDKNQKKSKKVNPFGRIKAAGVSTYAVWIDREDPAWDMAVIRLKEPIGRKAGCFGMQVAPFGLYSGMLYNAGYPGDKPMRSCWQDHKEVKDKTIDNFINHRLDTYGGNSGSPLWVYADGDSSQTQPRVLAVHAYGGGVGNPNNNAGVALTDHDLHVINIWSQT